MGSTQRGGVIRRNDNGTLERVGKTNTYIGSATLPDGSVITKRFRRNGFDEEEVSRRWLKWQGRKTDDDEQETEDDCMANSKAAGDAKVTGCPFSENECKWTCPLWSEPNRACAVKLGGVALYNISTNLSNLDNSESIELLAMAIGEAGGTVAPSVDKPSSTPVVTVPTAEDGISAYVEGRSFLSFVNLHSKTVYAEYKRFCEEKGFPTVKEKALAEAIGEKYPELKCKGVSGGIQFTAA